MKEGIHITRSSKPASSHETRLAEQRSEAFLEASEGENECNGCTTAAFCNAVITHLSSELTPRKIEDHELFLKSHGIEIDSEQPVCPGRLARTAIRQIKSGDFWIAESDPLNHSAERLQIGEALLFATQTLVDRIRKGQAL